MNFRKLTSILLGFGFFAITCAVSVFGLMRCFPPVQIIEIEKEIKVEKIVFDTIYLQVEPRAVRVNQSKKKPTQIQRDYIQRFAKLATTEMEKYGIPASITLAQGLLESKAGQSRLVKEMNNHFGIKCHSKSCALNHCKNFPSDHKKDFFRNYDSAWQSYRSHSLILSGKRYRELKKHGNDFRAWAQGLKEKGYATDTKYAEKLIQLIEDFELFQFDKGQS